MNWTDARIEVLKRMAAAGATFSEVAKALGNDCTRNMVAGKAHRLRVKFAPSVAKNSRASRAFRATLTMEQQAAWDAKSLGKGRAVFQANCAARRAQRQAAA